MIVRHAGNVCSVDADHNVKRIVLVQYLLSVGTSKQLRRHALEGQMVRRIEQLRFQPIGVGIGDDGLQDDVGLQAREGPLGNVRLVGVAPTVVDVHPLQKIVPGVDGVELVVAPSGGHPVSGSAEVQVVDGIGQVRTLDVGGGVPEQSGNREEGRDIASAVAGTCGVMEDVEVGSNAAQDFGRESGQGSRGSGHWGASSLVTCS